MSFPKNNCGSFVYEVYLYRKFLKFLRKVTNAFDLIVLKYSKTFINLFLIKIYGWVVKSLRFRLHEIIC